MAGRAVKNLLTAGNERPAPGSYQLLPHVDELRELINRAREARKPKTAFLVVRTKYELSVSYATFKRFARQQGLSRVERKRMIRIELPPGMETQLDYGKVGTLHFRKLDQREAEMLYVLAEERLGRASTILTPNRPPVDG